MGLFTAAILTLLVSQVEPLAVEPSDVVVAVSSSAKAPSATTFVNAVVRGLTSPALRPRGEGAGESFGSCDTADCFQTAGVRHRATFLVRGTVETTAASRKGASRTADYLMRLDVLDASTGEPVVDRQETACPRCKPGEAEDVLYYLAIDMRRKLLALPRRSPPARPDLASETAHRPSAIVEPPERPEPAIPRAAATGDARARWGKVAGITSIALGAAATGLGIFYLTIDGNGDCDTTGPGFACPRRYETTVQGWTLIGLGGAAVAAGLLFTPWSSSSGTAVSVGPSSVVLTGRF